MAMTPVTALAGTDSPETLGTLQRHRFQGRDGILEIDCWIGSADVWPSLPLAASAGWSVLPLPSHQVLAVRPIR